MPDQLFSVPRLAEVYDALDRDRGDLDGYLALLAELGARSVIDVGCGTGSFALLLAQAGLRVIGVDPAEASLDVARRKPNADRVQWVPADAGALPATTVDAVTMTGNVAQVFVADREWTAALKAAYGALRPGGHLVFESRNPKARAWESWTPDQSRRTALIPGGAVASWVELLDVTETTVSFRTTFAFSSDGSILTSESTLRFRNVDEVIASLQSAGFESLEVREAPDRPGLEHVFIARRQVSAAPDG